MKSIARIALLWVMVIAMPAQAIAATLMLFCGPSHERMMAGTGHAHHSKAHDVAHDHAAASAGVAHHGPGPSEAGLHGASPSGETSRSLADLGMFSCSACAACCFAVGLPATLSLPAQAASKHVVSTSLSAGIRSHLPDGPDRPPRTILA